MAHPLEEKFVTENLIIGDIFEFGAGDCSWAKRVGLQVHTIDLYPIPGNVPENVIYQQGNLIEFDWKRQFANVVSLSAIEHSGIESFHFENNLVNLNEIEKVAKKLSSLVMPKGKLLVTVPAGLDEIYGTIPGQEDQILISEEDNNSFNFKWGYRTFTLNKLLSLFPDLKLICSKAYLRKNDGNYFLSENWDEIDPLKINNRYKEQNGLLCIALERS